MVDMSIRHINYDFEELRKVVASAIAEVPNIVNTMNDMRKTILNEEEKVSIAKEVIKIRKGLNSDEMIEVDKEVIDDILKPLREEDRKHDLWTIFNICQEKMIKGGFSLLSKTNKMRKQRNITSIKKDTEFNQRLWHTATRYLKTA
jgi:hypothetical protein